MDGMRRFVLAGVGAVFVAALLVFVMSRQSDRGVSGGRSDAAAGRREAGARSSPGDRADEGAAGSGRAGREIIATPRAPAAIGPYSQAVRVGDALWCAGQIGMDPATGKLVEGGIEAQTRQALANLAAVCEAAGFSLNNAVQTQIFLADLADFETMNRVYAERFPQNPPARATAQVARLPRDARVEILLVAHR